jgi:hypothetical protein
MAGWRGGRFKVSFGAISATYVIRISRLEGKEFFQSQ